VVDRTNPTTARGKEYFDWGGFQETEKTNTRIKAAIFTLRRARERRDAPAHSATDEEGGGQMPAGGMPSAKRILLPTRVGHLLQKRGRPPHQEEAALDAAARSQGTTEIIVNGLHPRLCKEQPST